MLLIFSTSFRILCLVVEKSIQFLIIPGKFEIFNNELIFFRYDTSSDRYGYYDRVSDRPYDQRAYYERPYERPNYDRTYDRGNGYDNLDTRYSDDRYDRYNMRRPTDDPYDSRYDRYYRYYMSKYDRNDPYERTGGRRPYDDRYDRYGGREPVNSRGYYSSGSWSPGYDRGYASGWNYSGSRDNWRDSNRDRDRDREGLVSICIL